MAEIRIRSKSGGAASPWVYIQEQKKVTAPKAGMFKVKAAAVMQKRARTNQYGRFRFSEYQYGKLEGVLASAIEISKTPMRIRNQNGEWVYFGQVAIDGACPGIRIRNRNNQDMGPWVYIQHQEV